MKFISIVGCQFCGGTTRRLDRPAMRGSWRELLLLLSMGASVMVAGPAFSAGPTVLDPFIVYYPGEGCESGILEMEVWNRSKSAWQAHPHHSRILAGSCQREDAGGLLNEVRTRCADSNRNRSDGPTAPHSSPTWKVGFSLGQLREEADCERPIAPMTGESSHQIELSHPPPNVPIRSRIPKTEIKGRVDLDVELIVLIDRSLGPTASRALEDALERLLVERQEELGSLRIAWLTFRSDTAVAGATRSESPRDSGGPGDSQGRTIVFDDSAVSLGSRLRNGMGPSGRERRGGLVDALTTVRQSWRRTVETTGPRRSLIAYVNSHSPLPFGGASRADPVYRERLLDEVSALRARGVDQQYVLIGRHESALDEFVDRLRGRLVADASQRQVHVLETGGRLDGPLQDALVRSLAMPLSKVQAPVLEGLEIINERNGILAADVELAVGGGFRGGLPLESGVNRIRIEAVLSNGAMLVAVFDRAVDSARQRKGRVQIELERPQ